MSQIYLLYHLQQIDSEIKEKKDHLRDVLHAQQQTGPLLAARQRAKETEVALHNFRTQQKDLELELGGVNEKAQRSEQRLYSGKVSNPKELTDLQHEIEALGRRRRVLEDEILEAMVMVEEADADFQDADQSRKDMEANWTEKLTKLQAEQNILAKRINELVAQRNDLVQRIDGRMMKAYESAGRNKQGLAVATLKRGICSACGVTASAQKVKQVDAGELVYCGSCGRILYAG